jgi:hypothetical protein
MNLQRAIKSIIYLVVFTWTVFLFVEGQGVSRVVPEAAFGSHHGGDLDSDRF